MSFTSVGVSIVFMVILIAVVAAGVIGGAAYLIDKGVDRHHR